MIKKFILIILALFCIGVPIINNFGYFLFFSCLFIISFGSLRSFKGQFIAIFCVFLIVIISKFLLPTIKLQEGHNIFIFKSSNEALEKGLPKDVFSYSKNLFLKKYPKDKSCSPEDGACWRKHEIPNSTFSFSTDSSFKKPKYSRIVDFIEFDNLTQFRGGFVNENSYNWYGSSDIKRESMPFFVMYEFNKQSIGSSICWQGHCLWEESVNKYIPYYHLSFECRMITDKDVGKHIYGISIDNSPQLGFWQRFKYFVNNKILKKTETVKNEQLAIKLKLSPVLYLSSVINSILLFLGVLIIVILGIKIRFKDIKIPLLLIVLAAIIIYIYCPHLFGQYFIHEGGEDGLTHQTLGRNIFKYAIEGKWLDALMGCEEVYWNTPGFRYFRAFEKLIFGDTNYGYLTVVLFLPYIFFGFLSQFISKNWSMVFSLIFLIGVAPFNILQNLGLSFYLYVMVVRGGWPDTLGYTAFLSAIFISFKHLSDKKIYMKYGLLANFLLFISVFMRPNLAVAAIIIVVYLAFRLFLKKRYLEIFVTSIGFLPVLFMLWHNFYFGGKLYPFTGSVSLALQSGVHPIVYLNVIKEMLRHNYSGPDIERIISHLHMMFQQWYKLALLAICFFVAFFRHNLSLNVRIIAIVCLSLHFFNFFFFAVYFRYVFLTWALTSVVSLTLVYHYLKLKKNHSKKEVF